MGTSSPKERRCRHDGSIFSPGGPQENKKRGSMRAKDKPDRNRDANGKSNNDPEVKKVSDGSKQKSDDRAW